jgi:starvation-inducible DNA-binding protein
MSTNDHTQVLHPSRIDLPLEIRLYTIQLLNQTLACTIDLRSQVRQACWNVKGKDFSLLHSLFATIVIELAAYTDLVAERIVVLGGVLRGTVRMAAMQSKLQEYPDPLVESNAHMLALAERFAYYSATLREGIALATDVEDAGSAALYTDLSRKVDKQIWVLEAHLHS